MPDRIVIAGATGFIGHAVAQRLAGREHTLEIVTAVGGLDRARADELLAAGILAGPPANIS